MYNEYEIKNLKFRYCIKQLLNFKIWVKKLIKIVEKNISKEIKKIMLKIQMRLKWDFSWKICSE